MTPGDEASPPAPDLAGLGERGLIRRIQAAASRDDPRLLRGIGDDALVWAAPAKIAITTDLLVEDVHFQLGRTPPRRLGRKAMAVNLSDLAAMAAVPRLCLLGLAAPARMSAAVLDEIMAGFLERADEAGVTLAGGDVCRGDKLTLAVTLVGGVEPPAPVYRSEAAAGDLIFVTGTVGDSALGLSRLLELSPPVTEAMIAAEPLAGPILRHLDPEPQLAAGAALAGTATSMIDLSDGIVSDLTRILEESRVPGAVIELDRLPLSPEFREYFRVGAEPAGPALRAALQGGEDYGLLFTARPGSEERVQSLAASSGTRITRVGRLEGDRGVAISGAAGPVDLPTPLFAHF